MFKSTATVILSSVSALQISTADCEHGCTVAKFVAEAEEKLAPASPANETSPVIPAADETTASNQTTAADETTASN